VTNGSAVDPVDTLESRLEAVSWAARQADSAGTELAVRRYNGYALGYCHKETATPLDKLHGATGLQEEVIELQAVLSDIWEAGGVVKPESRAALKEECGGVMWYVSYCAHLYGVALVDVMRYGLAVANGDTSDHLRAPTVRRQGDRLLVSAMRAASLIKKNAYHGRPMESTDALKGHLFDTWLHTRLCLEPYKVLILDGMLTNLEQLWKRHGGPTFRPTVYTTTATGAHV
jgi:NTP pyrophosphatase (non-canonical NTP hydrolase)